MSPVKEYSMRRLALVVVVVGSVSGCGGGDESEVQSTSKLLVAPTALVDRDLPGCGVLPSAPSSRWGMMRHPQDAELVLVTLDKEPVCIDTFDGAMVSLSGAGVSLGQLTIGPTEVETTTTTTPPPPEGSSSESSSVRGKIVPDPHSLIADDPLPPPGHSHALVLRR
jgi:hypothetical protein